MRLLASFHRKSEMLPEIKSTFTTPADMSRRKSDLLNKFGRRIPMHTRRVKMSTSKMRPTLEGANLQRRDEFGKLLAGADFKLERTLIPRRKIAILSALCTLENTRGWRTPGVLLLGSN